MQEYGQSLLIDLLSVTCCLALLLRFGNLRFSHPGTPYMIFHVHTVSVRLLGLFNGAETMYSNAPQDFEPVLPSEIIRAALYCDFALWMVTLVWVLFALRTREDRLRTNALFLEKKVLDPILAVAFVMGIVGLRIAAHVPGISAYDGLDPSSDWSTSSYLIILPSWFGLAVLGLYSTVFYSVSQRQAEMAIRTALGAQPFDIFATVLRHTAWVAVIGAAVGVGAGLALLPLASSIFFGIGAVEPGVLGGVALISMALALATTYVVARPWTRMASVEILRR